jgi:hypothetical protein
MICLSLCLLLFVHIRGRCRGAACMRYPFLAEIVSQLCSSCTRLLRTSNPGLLLVEPRAGESYWKVHAGSRMLIWSWSARFFCVLRPACGCFICARVPVAWRFVVLSRRGWRHQQPGPQWLCKRLHQHRARRHFSRSLRAQGTSGPEGRDQGRKGYAEGACSSLKNMLMLPRK